MRQLHFNINTNHAKTMSKKKQTQSRKRIASAARASRGRQDPVSAPLGILAPPVRTRPAEGRLPQSPRTDPDPARRKPLRHEARIVGVGLKALPPSDFGTVESCRRELDANGRNAVRFLPLPSSARSSFTTIQFSAESKNIDFAGLFANIRPPPSTNHHKFLDLLFSRRASDTVILISPLPEGVVHPCRIINHQ